MTALKTLLSFTFSILLASSMLGGPGNFLGALPESAHAVTRNLTLEGWTGGWNSTLTSGICSPTGTPMCNPTITVSQGDSVDLTLPRGDNAPHQFFIDEDSNPPRPDCTQDKCSGILPTAYQFVVDFAPATYKYYCSFHQGSMQGDFVVQGFRIDSSPSSLRVIRGSSNVSTITVTSVNNFEGVVSLNTAVSPSGPTAVLNPTCVTLSPGEMQTSTLNVSASGNSPVGNYNVNVTALSGSASGNRVVSTLVVASDFGISADPTRLVIPLGSARNSTITLTSLDTFSGNVSLSMSLPPAGITATLTRNSVILSSGGTNTSRLDVYVPPATTPGTYTVNVAGTSGFFTHTTTVTVVAGPDIDIALNPTTLTLTPGSTNTSTITLTSFNNFAGTVNLSATATPGGTTFSFNPSIVSLFDGGTTTAVLTVNAPDTAIAANYTVTVNATSVLLTHLSTIIVSVRDFSVTVSSASLTIHQGTSVTMTVSITSLNRFVGDVSLATTASSSTLFRLLNVSNLSLNPSRTRFAALTINASSVQPGTYTVSITGTSGSLSRAASLSMTVQPSTSGASTLPLIGGAAVAAIAVATAVLHYTKRRRLGGKTSDSQIPT